LSDDPKTRPAPLPASLPLAFADYSTREFLGVWYPTWPRRTFDELFANGRVRSGGRPVGADRKIGELEDLCVTGDLSDLTEIHHREASEEAEIPVLFEDERVVVLAKPAGISVVPDRTRASRGGTCADGGSCLGFLLRRELAQRARKPVDEYVRLRVVHRIDRMTSGVVMFAKTPGAERELASYFESRRVEKEYRALLVGEVLPARVQVDAPVASGRKGRMKIDPQAKDAKPADTDFDVLERLGDFTFVAARPRTGRTHQIRVHALAFGHPLAVDPLYRVGEHAAAPSPPGIDRLTLHAFRYRLPSEWTGVREFGCPLPDDFLATLDDLRAL